MSDNTTTELGPINFGNIANEFHNLLENVTRDTDGTTLAAIDPKYREENDGINIYDTFVWKDIGTAHTTDSVLLNVVGHIKGYNGKPYESPVTTITLHACRLSGEQFSLTCTTSSVRHINHTKGMYTVNSEADGVDDYLIEGDEVSVLYHTGDATAELPFSALFTSQHLARMLEICEESIRKCLLRVRERGEGGTAPTCTKSEINVYCR